MNNNIRTTIITVTFNTERFVKEYFTSIMSGRPYRTGVVEVLVYDANSSDGTFTALTEYTANDNIFCFKGPNIGFAAANNYLAGKARGEALFILNPDTRLGTGCLEELEAKGNRGSIKIPKQVAFDGTVISNGNGVDLFGYPYTPSNLEGKLFYADGAALYLPKKVYEKLGGFDEDYFMFHEDVDLSWRARLAGITFSVVPTAIVYHYSGGSIVGGAVKKGPYITSLKRRYLGERNTLQTLIKNYSCSTLLLVLPLYTFINLAEVCLFLATLKPKVAYQYLRAYRWIAFNIRAIIKKRCAVQKVRCVSDQVIIKRMYIGIYKAKLLTKIGLPKFV